MRKSRNRVDAPTKSIRDAVRQVGGVYVDCTGDGSIGFDCILAFRGRLFLCEIKNGEKPPSARKLTGRELTRAAELARAGVLVHLVFDAEDALQIIEAAS